jgi:hypothetical protein
LASNRLAWLGGAALGAVALARALTRRPPPAPVYAPPAQPEAEPSGPDPRAEELRAKLDESRSVVGERESFEAGETPVNEAPDPAERRRRVHEQGRSALDEMRGSGGG